MEYTSPWAIGVPLEFLTVDPAFTPGDQVELKSGGLPLTVLAYCDDCGEVDVAYTDSQGDVEILTLPAAALQPIEDDEPGLIVSNSITTDMLRCG